MVRYCGSAPTAASGQESKGDVDDLIFREECWLASDR